MVKNVDQKHKSLIRTLFPKGNEEYITITAICEDNAVAKFVIVPQWLLEKEDVWNYVSDQLMKLDLTYTFGMTNKNVFMASLAADMLKGLGKSAYFPIYNSRDLVEATNIVVALYNEANKIVNSQENSSDAKLLSSKLPLKPDLSKLITDKDGNTGIVTFKPGEYSDNTDMQYQ